MSEFSESYHLRSERQEDAVELLRRAKLKGYVYHPTGGWVTFLAEQGVFEPDRRIVDAARHPLLHYVSAEDHGWSFALYDGSKVVSGYRCEWDDDITADDSQYSRAALQKLVPTLQSSLLDDFEKQLHPTDFDELFEADPSKVFAQAIGLAHYDWLSYSLLEHDFHGSPASFPGVIEVT
jgi:hypothetical protein